MMSSRRVVDLRKGANAQKPVSAQNMRKPEAPKRVLPLRIRRRRQRVISVALIFLILAALTGAISWLSYLPELTINHIEVTGTKIVPAQFVIKSADAVLDAESRSILSQRNIFAYPRYAIEHAIPTDLPRIKSAIVSRSKLFATSLTVHVEERIPYAIWCTAPENCYMFDESGYIFAEHDSAVEDPLQTVYVFYGGIDAVGNPVGQNFVPDHFHALRTLLKFIGDAGFAPTIVRFDGEQDLHILLKDFMLKVSFGQDVNALVKNLQLVLSSGPLKGKESQLEYVDLRFNNRVYYKLKGEVETKSPEESL